MQISASPTKQSRNPAAIVGGILDTLLSNPWAARGGFLAASLTLIGFSFGWVWVVGHRGLFVLDQSIVFDGAWRIVQGQVPYRDFYMPFGPVTFALQALMFRLAGVDFSTLVLTAALSSVLATAAATRLLWLLSSGSKSLSLAGAFLTAVWFQAPFGIPWMEQTAFLFNLLSLLAVLEGRLRSRRPAIPFALAGAASVAAVLSKQNAGGLFVFVCIGCLCLPWRGRKRDALRGVRAYGAGAALSALAFAAWLRAFSDSERFVHYWFELSSSIGMSRIAYWKILGTLVFQPLVSSSIPLFILSSIVGGAALMALLFGRTQAPVSQSSMLAAWLALALPQFHSAFQLTTNNDASNNNAYVGICVACTLMLVLRLLRGASSLSWQDARQRIELPSLRPLAGSLVVALGGLGLYSVGDGLSIAFGRFVQEFPAGVHFSERLQIRRASRLLWGEPTRITPQVCSLVSDACNTSAPRAEGSAGHELLNRRDFERVAVALETRDQNFFVFPDATILYGLTGKPSPQPLLYFHPGQSFAVEDQNQLDRLIVDSLVKNEVRLVVLERASFMGTHRLLSSLPLLDAWLRDNFEVAEEFGNYRLLQARSGAVPLAATYPAEGPAPPHGWLPETRGVVKN